MSDPLWLDAVMVDLHEAMNRWRVSPEKRHDFQTRIITLGVMHERGRLGRARLLVEEAMALVEPSAGAWRSGQRETIG